VERGGALIVIYAAALAGAESNVKAAGGTIVKPIFSFPGPQVPLHRSER
jgi:predicted enzyme related to lactoylglutathione lyase